MDNNENRGNYYIPTFLNSSFRIIISAAITYYSIARLSLFLFTPQGNIPPFFPAIGFAIAAAIILGRTAILGTAIGSLLFSIHLFLPDIKNATTFQELSTPLLYCFVRPLILSINAYTVMQLSQYWFKNKYPFTKGTHVLLFATACFLGTLISISIGMIPLALTSSIPFHDFKNIWINWFGSNTLGTILLTPLALSFFHKNHTVSKWTLSKKLEAILLTITTIIISLYVFNTKDNNESILLFLLIWAAYRFGVKIISLVIVIIASIASYCTTNNLGQFAFNYWENKYLMLQLFLFVNMVSILFLKAILEEKESKEERIRKSEQKLNTERDILKATIESSNETSIFSLDTDLNYMSFNHEHEKFMKNTHAVSIKIGANHLALISNDYDKNLFMSIYSRVLNGNNYSIEEKDSNGNYWKISKSPVKNINNEIIGVTVIVTNITELKLNEIELKKNNYTLNERIKEISCLYNIFEICNNKTLSEKKIIDSCVKTIPNGLQSPEFANCRIIINGKEFKTKEDNTKWLSLNTIWVYGTEYGTIEAGYIEEKANEYSLWTEELQLLETTATLLSKSLEKNLANKKLKASEDNYRILFENVQDVFFKTSLVTETILDVSPSCSNFNGITREEIIGQHISSIYPNKDLMQDMFQKVLAEKEIIDYSNEIIIKDELFYVSVNAKIINDENGAPNLVVGSFRDITKRKMAEEKLKTTQADYRTLFENVQDVFFKSSLKNETILDISPSCSHFSGITREELIGQNMYFMYPDQKELDTMLEKLFKQKRIIDYNNKIVIKGNLFHVSINAQIVDDLNGEPEYVLGSFRDITERRLAEENLKISEEKFRSIFENLEDVYFKKDLDGKIIDVSPSAEKYFQLKREQIIGLNCNDFYADKDFTQKFYEIILQEQHINDYLEQLITPSGELMYFSVNASLRYDTNGQPSYIEGTMRNINERIINQKQIQEANEKIKESEAKFRSIFENTQDIYYMHTLEGKIFEISPSVEKHLKYKREEVIGLDTRKLHYDLVKENKLREKIIKEGGLNNEHVQFLTATGEPLFFSVNCKIIHNQDGIPSHVEGSLRNIDEKILSQKQLLKANEKIKESEKKYRNIFENARDVFFVGSIKEDILIDISPSCAYFGVQPEDIIGKSIEDFYFDPKDRKEVLEARNKYGEIKDYIVRYVFNDKPYHVSLNSKITYNQKNEPEFLIGSFTDVTDRIQAEENLKVSEAKFRSIYENFEDVYFKTRIDGTIVELSPSFEKHFLKPCEQFIGSSVMDLYYNKKDRTSLLEKLKIGNHISDFDAQFIDAEGNVKFFSINAHFLYESGIPIYIEGTLRNVNERVATQKEMAAKNRKLEFQNTELEQFAYIASHDLQEPLITINYCINLLSENLNEKLDEEQKQYLKFISNSTSRMQILVKGLLDYSRIGKNQATSNIDCNEVVAHVLADMEASLNESKALIEYENLPIIEGNGTEIRQLFQNLISNANKFRKKGHRPKIKIAAEKEENNWVFSVQDNGIGIEEKDMDKVFVIFKRLHNRDEYTGTGIGLSHCKKIIEQNKGKIWVESKTNEGSIFKWTHPISAN